MQTSLKQNVVALLLTSAAVATIASCSGSPAQPDDPRSNAAPWQQPFERGDLTDPVMLGDGSAGMSKEDLARIRIEADSALARAVAVLGESTESPLIELGFSTFQDRCSRCHSQTIGEHGIGPSLGGIWGSPRLGLTPGGEMSLEVFDLEYLSRSINDPSSHVIQGVPGKMPSFRGEFYPRQVLALAVYIKSLTPDAAPAAAPPPVVPPANARRSDSGATDADSAATPSPGASPTAPPSPVDPPEVDRGDGRPSWWFDGVQQRDGRPTICAEVLAESFPGARRAVVDRGRTLLAAELGGTLRDVRVDYTSVEPLAGEGGRARYVGYAMISAAP